MKTGSLLLVILTFLPLLSTPSHADSESECTAVDLSDKFGKVRHQGLLEWCFAYAAADLLSYEMKQEVSATGIGYENALLTTSDSKEIVKTGGSVEQSIRAVQKNGAIAESLFPSRGKVFIAQLEADQKVIEHDYQRANAHRLSFSSATDAVLTVSKPWQQGEALITLLHKALNLSQPAEVGIDGNAIESWHIVRGPEKADHAVLVVGRRWNNDKSKCEFKIRNSWGEKCEGYKKSIECDHGYLWMTSKMIRKAADDVIFFEPL